jgi:curved DNA-binding protein CbpA
MTVDHYGRLGVTRTATHDEIRQAYRRLARRLHPDTHGGAVSAEMVAVNEAWRVLSDKGRRSAYDAKLRVESSNSSPPSSRPPSRSASRPASGPGSQPPPRTDWRFAGDVDDDFGDAFVDDETFLGREVDTVASRRWMVLITFTMIAAAVLLTALFVYAFVRSGSTAR